MPASRAICSRRSGVNRSLKSRSPLPLFRPVLPLVPEEGSQVEIGDDLVDRDSPDHRDPVKGGTNLIVPLRRATWPG